MSDPYLNFDGDNDLSSLQVNLFRVRNPLRDILPSERDKILHNEVILMNPKNIQNPSVSGIRLREKKIVKEKKLDLHSFCREIPKAELHVHFTGAIPLDTFIYLAKKNDVLVCISTSGNSNNILKVLREAKKEKIYSVCFLGKGGGKARKISNKSLTVSSNNTARIQECHIFIGHFILEKIENLVLSEN